MKNRRAWLIAVIVFLSPAAGLIAQDPGTPFPPAGLGLAYICNNTPEPIRYVICSSTGVTTSVLPPAHYGKISFEYVNRPRMLTVFSLSNGGIISNRQVELHPQHYYLAMPDSGPGPVVAPGQPKGPVPLKGLAVDKGSKQLPMGLKEAPAPGVGQEKP